MIPWGTKVERTGNGRSLGLFRGRSLGMPHPVLRFLLALLLGLSLEGTAFSMEDADELYRQGRFVEAERAYASLGMDSPKDLRYLYNRGCAAYNSAGYHAAFAAFSIVFERAKDPDMRFRAAYNLGNTAYRMADFLSAVNAFKTALRYRPSSEDARHNLELALSALARHQKAKEETAEHQAEGSGENGKEKIDQSGQARAHDERVAAEDKKGVGKELSEDVEEVQSSGLRNREFEIPGKLPGEQGQESVSMLDRKKAQAFLENLRENPSQFIRYRMRGEKSFAGRPEKDW